MKLMNIVNRFSGVEQITDLDISEIEVNRISVFDSLDFMKWTSPNEIPITSGYIFHITQVNLEELFRSYHAAGLIGMFIKVDRFLREIPQNALDAANEIGFPLIQVPNHYSFSDILIPVTNQIMSEKLAEVNESNEIIREFINLAISGDSIHNIVYYLYKTLGRPLVFEDYILNQKISSPDAGTEDILNDRENYYYKLKLGNSSIGKLTIQAKEIYLTTQELLSVEYAAKTLILAYKEKIALNQVEERYKEDFVTDICQGNITSIEEIHLRSKLYGIDVPERFSVVIFDIDNYKAKTIELGQASGQLKLVRQEISQIINYHLFEADVNFASYSISDSFIYILDIENMEQIEQRQELLLKISNRVLEKINFSLTIGVGQEEKDILKANRSFEQARDAVRVSRILYGSQKVTRYKDIQPFVLLENMASNLPKDHSLLKPLNELVEFDRTHETSFLQDLIRLVECDWSIAQFAKEEIIHYNTAKYRVNKIEDISQLDLKNPKNKFNLELALKLYQLNSHS